MTVSYKYCKFYNKGNCDLEFFKWGYTYPCNKRNYCVDLTLKGGYVKDNKCKSV